MNEEQIIIAITKLQEQVSATRKDIADLHTTTVKYHERLDRRVNDLEHSRTKLKAVITAVAVALTFVGWEAGAEWVNHIIK